MKQQQFSNNLEAPSHTARDARGAETILVVDDDAAMRAALLKLLRYNGFNCVGAADAYAMAEVMEDRHIDLILLDVMLPGVSGFDICRELRLRDDSHVAVIMISARDEEMDKVMGLELGADDYLAKPFGDRELLARVRAVLRRGRSVAAVPALTARTRRLRFCNWTADLPSRQLFAPSGAEVELSGAEYDLLIALLENPQRVIAREPLLEMSRSRLGHASDRTVDVHICRLRRKLGDEEQRELIRTVRGVGYIFTAEVEAV